MTDTISFPFYPSSNRTFGIFADVDGSRANTALFEQRALLLGQMHAGAGAAPSLPTLITSAVQAATLFGTGSMLHEMVRQYLKSDTFGELWAAGLPDPAGTAAAGTISFAGAALGTGTCAVYIGGVSLPVPVLAGDTPALIAQRLVGIMTANPDCPVGGNGNAGVVTLTANHAGLLGNDIDIRLNFLGASGGEFAVPGLAVTIAPMAGGSGVPSLAATLANTGDVTYDFIATPYTDTASLNALDAYFNFSAGRWSWQSMLYGGYFCAARGTPGALAALGQARNGPNGSCLGVYDTPDPVWIVAADYCANCAVSLRIDPNVPLQNIVLGFQAPPRTSSFIRSLRNTLLYDGISTFTVNRAGQPILERAITFFQLNAAGSPDNSFLDVETLYGTALLIRGWKQEMLRLFPRCKLFEDGNAIPAGQNATTAAQIRIATIAWYRAECAAGNAQDPDVFAKAVIAQNAGNGLVKELLPFLLPNQLRQVAGLVQFTKP